MNCLKLTVLLAFILSLSSCGNDDKRLEEVAGIQGQESAERQVEEENRNLAVKAKAMEADLVKRTNYYMSLEGDFQGEIDILSQKGMIELNILVNNRPAPTDRETRTLEEITNDLNKISLSVLIKHYAPNSRVVVLSCQMYEVRPDIKQGVLSLAKEGCPNFYHLSISKTGETPTDPEPEVATYSQEVYTSPELIPYLKGHIDPGATPGKFPLLLKRISPENEGE